MMCWKAHPHPDAFPLTLGQVEQEPPEGQRVDLAASTDAFVAQEDLGSQVRRVAP
jgi:hypothetical protein